MTNLQLLAISRSCRYRFSITDKMKDESNKIKLGMTKEEVIDILGEPDGIEKGIWYSIFHYEEENPYTMWEIKFVDGAVVSIHTYGVVKEEEE